MKVSIVTAAYNSAHTLGATMKSVLKQTYPDIEYIVVDGSSTDNTKDVIRQYEPQFSGRLKWVSEKDGGIYDAMNKGIRMATGDIVGILNSDDYFTSDDVIERMVVNFDDPNIDAVYGDIHFIHDGEPDKIVRYYSSKPFCPLWLRFGFMPAHPSFYCRRSVYEKAGLYKTDYAIGSDYEMMVRLFMVHRINARYIPIDFVTMRTGGASTKNVKSRLTHHLRYRQRTCRHFLRQAVSDPNATNSKFTEFGQHPFFPIIASQLENNNFPTGFLFFPSWAAFSAFTDLLPQKLLIMLKLNSTLFQLQRLLAH